MTATAGVGSNPEREARSSRPGRPKPPTLTDGLKGPLRVMSRDQRPIPFMLRDQCRVAKACPRPGLVHESPVRRSTGPVLGTVSWIFSPF